MKSIFLCVLLVVLVLCPPPVALRNFHIHSFTSKDVYSLLPVVPSNI